MVETEGGRRVQCAGETAEVVVVQGRWAQLAGFPVRTQMWSLSSHVRGETCCGDEGRCATAEKCNAPICGAERAREDGLGREDRGSAAGLWTRARGGCGGGERKGRRRCGGSRQRRGQEERTHAASPLTPSNGLSTALAGTRLRLRSRGMCAGGSCLSSACVGCAEICYASKVYARR
jgi:hypothetical protein